MLLPQLGAISVWQLLMQMRVLARLRRLSGPQKGSGMVKLNAQLADALVDPVRPGCFNQVLHLYFATSNDNAHGA